MTNKTSLVKPLLEILCEFFFSHHVRTMITVERLRVLDFIAHISPFKKTWSRWLPPRSIGQVTCCQSMIFPPLPRYKSIMRTDEWVSQSVSQSVDRREMYKLLLEALKPSQNPVYKSTGSRCGFMKWPNTKNTLPFPFFFSESSYVILDEIQRGMLTTIVLLYRFSLNLTEV